MMVKSIFALLLVLAVSAQETRNLGKPLVPANTFSFFFWGDWGDLQPAAVSAARGNSGIDFEEAVVAAQVTAYTKIYKPSFYVVLGDNFYEGGVSSTTDPLWNTYYENVYNDPVTMIPWYPILGNHDYYGKLHNPQAQIDFYREGRDSRWTFPDYQYTRTWTIPGSKKTVQMFFINTPNICPEASAGTNDDKIPWPINPTKSFPNSIAANNLTDRLIAEPPVSWVERALNASKADFKIVAGHYHVYANGPDKPEGLCLRARLVPLMKKYGVSAYMNGHQHNFQHWVVDGISYMTVGHGSDKNDILPSGTPAGLLFNRTVGGFAHMRAYSNKLHFDFIDESGTNIYNYDIPPPSHIRKRN